MAGVDRDSPDAEVKRQRYRLESLDEQLARMRVMVTAWPAAFLALLALVTPLYGPSEEAEESGETITLTQLASEAADVDNGAVQVSAVVLTLALVLLMGSCVALALGRNGKLALVTYGLAGVAAVVWLVLTLNVGSAGDGGVIGELGYESTLRILLVPLAPAAAVAAARAVREAE